MRTPSLLAVVAVLAAVVVGAGCDPPDTGEGEGEGEGEGAEGEGEGEGEPIEAEPPRLLDVGSGVVGDRTLPFELWRTPRADGKATYVQWVPAAVPGPRPVVVFTMPYDGIDWSDDEVDARFIDRGLAVGPDDACPEDNADSVGFAINDPVANVGNAAVYNLNDAAVLFVYGRFYACDGIDGDVLDMQAGLEFLKTVADADITQVATTGASWGGFLALYGAARVPDGVNVVVSSAIAPPGDMARMVRHTQELVDVYPADLQADLAFFPPYLRRIIRPTGGLPGVGDFSAYSTSSLCEGLGSTELLLLHDEWDTLVPFDGSTTLVDECSKDGLWWRRQTPIDYRDLRLEHGAINREPGYPSVFTFLQSYVVMRLNDGPAVYVLASPQALTTFLTTVHDEQAAGDVVDEVIPRLVELADARMFIFNTDTNAVVSGASVVAAGVNAVWGTDFDDAGIRAQLALGALPAIAP